MKENSNLENTDIQENSLSEALKARDSTQGALLPKLSKEERREKHEASFRERFTRKLYYDQYYSTWLFSLRVKFVFSLISVSTAFYFVYSAIENFLPSLGATIISSLILIIIELGKHILLPINVEKLYTEGIKSFLSNTYNLFFVVFNIGLIIISVYLSVGGIKEYNENERAVKPNLVDKGKLTNSYDVKRDSTNNYYQSLIKKKENRIATIQKSIKEDRKDPANYYQGKFSYLLTQDHIKRGKDISLINKQINALENARIKAIDEIKDYKKGELALATDVNKSETQKARQKTKHNTLFFVGLSGINELLMVICLWYSVFFAYKVDKEKKQLEKLFLGRELVEFEENFRDVMKRAFWFHKGTQRDFLRTENIEVAPVRKEVVRKEAEATPDWAQNLTSLLQQQQKEIALLKQQQESQQKHDIPVANPINQLDTKTLGQEIFAGIKQAMELESVGSQVEQPVPQEEVKKYNEISLRPGKKVSNPAKKEAVKFKEKLNAQVGPPPREADSPDEFLARYSKEILQVQEFFSKRKKEGKPKRVTNVYLGELIGVSDKTAGKIKKNMIAKGLLRNEDIVLS